MMSGNHKSKDGKDVAIQVPKSRRGRMIKYEGDVPLPKIPNVNYASFLLESFREREEDTALIDANSEKFYTYGDLRRHVLSVRNGLAAAGVEFGDAVILMSINHLDVPVAMLAIMLLGASCVPTNPALTKEELVNVVKLSDAKWAIANQNAVGKLEEVYSSVKPGFLRQVWILGDEPDPRPAFDDLKASFSSEIPEMDDKFDSAMTVAIIPFSSGTTGLPKGVMLSHRNILAVLIQVLFLKGLGKRGSFNPYTRTLMLIPLYHMYGFTMIMTTFVNGGSAYLMSKFSLEGYFQAIEKYQITFSPIVPHMVKPIIESPIMKQRDLSSLVGFTLSSAPISASAMDTFVKKSGKMAFQGYGMTETGGTGTTTRGQKAFKPDSVGPPNPFCQIKVVDGETGDLLGEREEGEICFKGPTIMLGYVNNPEATAEIIDNEGWLHTGDIGYYDEDNFIYITDRMKDLIKVKGYQVSPTELENVIKEVEGVHDVAVAGVPHERLGEAPRAWIVPREGANIDTNALLTYVKDRVASYKMLTGGVEIVESIPRSYIGKILRRQLQKPFKEARSKL